MGLTLPQATALSAGINFLGGLMSNNQSAQYNAEEAQKNRDFQERMYNQQVQDNINFWNMQNEYNLPSAVFERQLNGMRQNGLNPLLMYGEGGISNIGTSQQAPESAKAPSGAQGSSHFNNPIDLPNLAMLEAQTNLMNAQADKLRSEKSNIESQTKGIDFMNWLNDQTSQVQVALRYRDYDRVNQLIDESRQRVFNMHGENARAWSGLILQNSLAIRAQNLNEYQVGQNVMQGWEGLKIGRIQANAAMRSAAAAWLNARSSWNLSQAQVGLLQKQAAHMQLQNDFLDRTMDWRVYGENKRQKAEYWNYMNNMMNNLLIESNIKNVDSNTFLNFYRRELMESQSRYLDMQTTLAPLNTLSSFGSTPQPGQTNVGGNYYMSTSTPY